MSGGLEDRVFDAIHDALTDPTYLEVQGATDRVMALLAENQDGMSADDVEHVCEALMEVGGWDEIDGDGTPASIIADHIHRLPRLLAETQPKVLWKGPTVRWSGKPRMERSVVATPPLHLRPGTLVAVVLAEGTADHE